jgi:ABC-type multidrug transport system ATPase subunit
MGHSFDGVRIMGLSKVYHPKNVKALNDAYLEVSEGELLGIMGHNGAGKTTLINLLSGFVQLTDGTARIFGLSIENDLEHIRRSMGIVS